MAADARCAPIHDNVPLKVHVGPISAHVSNWKKAAGAGLPVRHLTYEELNDDHSKLDDIREWILGDQASDPRCAPDHRNTTLKVHVGPVSSHVANWEAVEETLRGTRYEHFLSE